eukprot:1159302-Pelagomonas_calceolata.AAC.3
MVISCCHYFTRLTRMTQPALPPYKTKPRVPGADPRHPLLRAELRKLYDEYFQAVKKNLDIDNACEKLQDEVRYVLCCTGSKACHTSSLTEAASSTLEPSFRPQAFGVTCDLV